MNYCATCVMPDTKPGVFLDEEGRCNACRAKDIKSQIDWSERKRMLDSIIKDIKKQDHPFYDCIIPVSGGKDSWFQALMLA